MDPIQALAMGIVQGLTEFLPISSSAHLVILPWLFQWKDPGLNFDVSLHVGTLLAVLAYFWRDWVNLTTGAARALRAGRPIETPDARMFWLLVLASIPGALVGAALENEAESTLRSPILIAVLTVGVGLFLVLAERAASRDRLLKHVGTADAAIIGIAQALAIFPGVSRSGITMTAGLFRGLTRESAARFSFLMSTPIIAGAALYNLRNLATGMPVDERSVFAIGFFSAAIVGFLTIKGLMRFLQTHSLLVFAYYRFAFGGLIAVLLIGRMVQA